MGFSPSRPAWRSAFSESMDGHSRQAALIKCTIEGLEVETDWPTLREFLQSEARFNQLCAKVVTPPRGVAIQLLFPVPKTVRFIWRDCSVEAMGVMGGIHIKARKVTHGKRSVTQRS